MRNIISMETIKITASFAGTLIGAGFASGQELMQFFAAYGPAGLIGTALSAVLFCWLGARLLYISSCQEFTSYHQLLYYVCGPKVGVVLDVSSGIFLLAGFSIMLAGIGTIGAEFFDIPYRHCLLGGTIILALTLLFGIRGIAAINLICTPLLAFFIIIVSINSLNYHGEFALLAPLSPQIFSPKASPHWLVATLLYVSYNLILASTVITGLGSQTKNRSSCIWGGIGGGLLLGVLALFVTLVILLHQPEIFVSELPMLYIAAQQNFWSYTLYCYALLVAMFTTASATLYGCTTKLRSITKLNYALNLIIVLILGLLLSHFGFSKLIAAIYPVFGYIAAWFTLRLVFLSLRDILWH